MLPGSHSTCAQPTEAEAPSCCCSTIPSPRPESRFRVRCHRDPPRLRPRRRNQTHNSDRQVLLRRRRKLVCLCRVMARKDRFDRQPTNRRTRPGHRSSGSQSRRPPWSVLVWLWIAMPKGMEMHVWLSSCRRCGAGMPSQISDTIAIFYAPLIFRDVMFSSAWLHNARAALMSRRSAMPMPPPHGSPGSRTSSRSNTTDVAGRGLHQRYICDVEYSSSRTYLILCAGLIVIFFAWPFPPHSVSRSGSSRKPPQTGRVNHENVSRWYALMRGRDIPRACQHVPRNFPPIGTL